MRERRKGGTLIISASRRTDIPRFHSEWMVNRVKEGFVDVRNPLFPTQVSRYRLDPSVVDGIVFWTKDPAPMLDKLDAFSAYPFYFQFSLTPYGKDIESGLRDKRDLVKTFKALAREIGSDRVVWRFDPILISEKYPVEYQLRAFSALAAELSGSVDPAVDKVTDHRGTGDARDRSFKYNEPPMQGALDL